MIKTPRVRQGPGCRPRASNRGRTYAVNGGRRRHMARVAETSGGGWWVTAFQVDGAMRQERRWGEVCTERFYSNELMLVGVR